MLRITAAATFLLLLSLSLILVACDALGGKPNPEAPRVTEEGELM